MTANLQLKGSCTQLCTHCGCICGSEVIVCLTPNTSAACHKMLEVLTKMGHYGFNGIAHVLVAASAALLLFSVASGANIHTALR